MSRRGLLLAGAAVLALAGAGCASSPGPAGVRLAAAGEPAATREPAPAGEAAAAGEAGQATRPPAWPLADRLPEGWHPLGREQVAAAFPHRSLTAETLIAARSGDGRLLAVVAADRRPSLVAFGQREGPGGIRRALDAYLPGVVQAFRRVGAVEGELTGQPALYYRFTGLASGAPANETRRFAMELVVVPAETAVYTVSLLDLSGAGRFAGPPLHALKASLRGLFEAAPGSPAAAAGSPPPSRVARSPASGGDAAAGAPERPVPDGRDWGARAGAWTGLSASAPALSGEGAP